mgnify:CR=1 FL=1
MIEPVGWTVLYPQRAAVSRDWTRGFERDKKNIYKIAVQDTYSPEGPVKAVEERNVQDCLTS